MALYGNFSELLAAIAPTRIRRRHHANSCANFSRFSVPYRSTHGLENIGAAAHKFGRKICMGAWITSDASANGTNATEMTNLIAHAQNGEADCAACAGKTNECATPNCKPISGGPSLAGSYQRSIRSPVRGLPNGVLDSMDTNSAL